MQICAYGGERVKIGECFIFKLIMLMIITLCSVHFLGLLLWNKDFFFCHKYIVKVSVLNSNKGILLLSWVLNYLCLYLGGFPLFTCIIN